MEEKDRLSVASRITKNSVFLLLSRFTEITFALLNVALITRYLGVDDFGDYSFVMAFVVTSVTVASFGVDFILTREIAQSRARADSLVFSAVVIRAVTFVILLVTVSSVLFLAGYSSRISLAIVLALTFENVRLLSLVFTSVFRAFEKMRYEVMLAFVTQGLTFCLIVAVTRLDLGFIAIFFAPGISHLVTAALSFVVIRRKFFRPRAERVFATVISLIRESYMLGFGIIIKTLYTNIDVMLLKAMRSSADVALFQAPHKLLLSLFFLPSSVVAAAFPAFARFSRDSRDSLIKSYEMLLKVILAIVLPMTVFLFAVSEPVIRTIFGPSFVAADLPFKILILAFPFTAADFLLSFVLISIAEQRLIFRNTASCLVINVLLDLLLIPKFSYTGAAVASFTAYLMSFLIVGYCVSISLRRIPVQALLKLFACGGLMWTFSHLFEGAGPFLVWPGAVLVFLGAVALLSVFEKDELGFLKKFLVSRGKPFSGTEA